MNLTIPQGSTLSIFAVGGGGAANGGTAGSSGFFKHRTVAINKTQSLVLDITIGNGGSYSGADGQNTTVLGLPSLSLFGSPEVSAQGGGGAGGPGWSGVSGDTGGFNGNYGSHEQLPILCPAGNAPSLTPGLAGSNQSDGKGAGGVIVDGEKPARRGHMDGEGYGAGGGEDDRSGYPGIVVLTLCDPDP